MPSPFIISFYFRSTRNCAEDSTFHKDSWMLCRISRWKNWESTTILNDLIPTLKLLKQKVDIQESKLFRLFSTCRTVLQALLSSTFNYRLYWKLLSSILLGVLQWTQAWSKLQILLCLGITSIIHKVVDQIIAVGRSDLDTHILKCAEFWPRFQGYCSNRCLDVAGKWIVTLRFAWDCESQVCVIVT